MVNISTQAMSFSQLIASVYVKTNRPDLIQETSDAVVAATLKMHTMDFFPKDIAPTRLVFDNEDCIQQIDTTIFPRWRAISYLKKHRPNSVYNANAQITPIQQQNYLFPQLQGMYRFWQEDREPITIISPDDIFDEFGYYRTNVAYQAGTNIFIRSRLAFRFLQIGFYQYPNVDTSNNGANFSSWVAIEYPFAIVYEATSNILQSIGQTDAARKYDNPQNGLVGQQVAMILLNNISAQGR